MTHETVYPGAPFFHPEEFACDCGCGLTVRDPEFLSRLVRARRQAAVPFRVTSGARCPGHNRRIGGAPASAHLEGLAADVACADSATRYRILAALFAAGFHRVGIARTFLHVDAGTRGPAGVAWLYE